MCLCVVVVELPWEIPLACVTRVCAPCNIYHVLFLSCLLPPAAAAARRHLRPHTDHHAHGRHRASQLEGGRHSDDERAADHHRRLGSSHKQQHCPSRRRARPVPDVDRRETRRLAALGRDALGFSRRHAFPACRTAGDLQREHVDGPGEPEGREHEPAKRHERHWRPSGAS